MLHSLRRGRHISSSNPVEAEASPYHDIRYRALDIPELVELILGYVVGIPFGFEGDSQPFENDIFRPQGLVPRADQGYHACLVSKTWNHVVTGLWRSNVSTSSDSSSFPSLQGCRRLAYNFAPTQEPQGPAINLLDELSSASNLPHVGGLRELLLAGAFTVESELTSLLALQNMTRNLTLLDLQFSSHQTLDIQLFFSPMSSLSSSSSSSSSSMATTFLLPNLKHFMLRQVDLVPLPEEWVLPKPPRLKSFCLNHARMDGATLDALVRSFCYDGLERLVLLSLVEPGSTTIGTHDRHLVVTEARISTITLLAPRLKTVMVNQPTGEQALTSLIDHFRATFPHADELATSHLTSVHDPVPAIFKVNSCLTRLEITLSTCWDRHEFPTPTFHAFLCSHHARHLQELHAPMVKYDAEYLEPSRRTEWTCRDLRLLALGFLPKERQDTLSATYSRNMFGFLVTTCPRLRSLELERALLVASRDSGLCFLSRLECLEELTLRTKYFYHWGSFDLTSRPLPPWWASLDPTLVQQLKHQDSLALCRAVSRRDPNSGHFGTLRGKGVLGKKVMTGPSNEEEEEEEEEEGDGKNLPTTAATAPATRPTPPTRPSTGACWHKLRTIRIQLHEELEKRNDERNQLRVRAIQKSIPHCRVKIEYVNVK
ncbi:hypothetical protein DFQ27_006451 [Actinomortierella ambigua]|uniref:Uncharacterized protein n=1 Tax=Actinomortierella ambigua TaxID=1343610 RepID=A0A9P6UC59_9FUNG|nr:hypothetical protein DFQ27_006451 [Actinomortierella ambigua]